MKVGVKHYTVLFSAALGSLFAGSQFMHVILKPDLTIPDLTTDAMSGSDANKKEATTTASK